MKSRISSLTETTGFIVPQSSWAGAGGGVGFCVEHADAMAPARSPEAMVAATQAARLMWPECTAGAAGTGTAAIGNLLTPLQGSPTGGTRASAGCSRVAFKQWLRIPPTCPHCGVAGRVKFECTVRGFTADLIWRCSWGAHEWPVLCGRTKQRGSRAAG